MPANLAGYPAFLLFVLCFLLSRVGAQKHTPHKTTRQGRSYLSMGRCFYPCGIHVGRIQYAPTLPAGDVSYLYPQRLPRTRHFLLLDLPFSMSPCRGVLNTPHKRPEGAILSIYRSPHLSLRDTYRAYSIRPYPTGRRCLLFIPTTFTTFPDPLVFSFPFFDLPSPYDSDRRYDCESRCDRATVYVRLEPVSRGLLH